ncbi:MAG: hypothetical protein ABR508_05090 [Candidatus Baltobacteraceae bacterium]
MRLPRALLIALFIAGIAFAAAGSGFARAAASPAPAAALESPPPIPPPAPAVENPKIHKLAVQQFLAWQTATVDRDAYSETVNADLSDELLDRATKTLANLGALQSAAFQGVSKTKAASLYVYKMACANGTVNMDFSVDPNGKIGLIFFV